MLPKFLLLFAIAGGMQGLFACSQTLSCTACNSGNFTFSCSCETGGSIIGCCCAPPSGGTCNATCGGCCRKINQGNGSSFTTCQAFSCSNSISCNNVSPCSISRIQPSGTPAVALAAFRIFGNRPLLFSPTPQDVALGSVAPAAIDQIGAITGTGLVGVSVRDLRYGKSSDLSEVRGVSFAVANNGPVPVTAYSVLLSVEDDAGSRAQVRLRTDLFRGRADILAGAQHPYRDETMLLATKGHRVVKVIAQLDFVELATGQRLGATPGALGAALDAGRDRELQLDEKILAAYDSASSVGDKAVRLHSALTQVLESNVGCQSRVEELRAMARQRPIDEIVRTLREPRRFE